jgi:hypothetical protein
MLLFNHGGALNFLNDFFSNPEHTGYNFASFDRTKDDKTGIQLTPEKQCTGKQHLLN